MGTLDLLYLVIFSIVTGAVGSWLANELTSLSDPVARWFVKKAAARLPEEHRKDYEAEWLQVLVDCKSPTMKLLHAAHLRFRAQIASQGAPVGGNCLISNAGHNAPAGLASPTRAPENPTRQRSRRWTSPGHGAGERTGWPPGLAGEQLECAQPSR